MSVTNVARVVNQTVVNIEVATPEWLDAYDGDDLIVAYTAQTAPAIGWHYDETSGTFSPPTESNNDSETRIQP